MSLRLRLSLLISLLLALLTLAVAAYALRSAREDVRAEVRSSADLAIRLLESEVQRARDSGLTAVPSFGLGGLREIRHVRIEFRDSGGAVIESNRDGHDSPGISAPAWFAWLVEQGAPKWPDSRLQVETGDKPAGELVVLPDPSFEIDEVWSDARHLLALLGILFLASNALVYWVVGRALAPVDRILNGLGEIEGGNLDTRLPELGLPELARIGGAFNRMMDTLQSTITRNRQLARQLLRVQEDERRALAHELHDEIGQYLTAIHADAAAISNVTREGPAGVRESAEAIVASARQVAGMVRGMLQRLHPETLESLGLQEAVRELVGAWRARNPNVQCRLEMAPHAGAVDDATGIAAYRVVQEALTNVTRHAGAGRVEVGVGLTDAPKGRTLNISVRDDGIGADSRPQPGYGLMGMRERVEALGGALSIETAPGRGFAVSATIPLVPAGGGS